MKKLLKITMALLWSLNSYAQIKGKVVDSTSAKPLEFITVSLFESEKIVQGTLSNDQGSFSFQKLKPGNYFIKISAVGYQQYQQAIDLKDSLNVGLIYLKENTNALEEVKVVAAKPILVQEADRLIYDIEADPEHTVLSALDMMRKVPYLSLDGEDNISLKDSRDFRIFINGRPSAMLARNYKDILRSMPASNIQKIEVITTPPSKYDGEGLAGIINIITSKMIDGGFMGNVNLSWMDPIGGPGLGTSVTARKGKWGISAFGGGSKYNNPSYSFINRRTTFGTENSALDQSGNSNYDSKSGYLGLELSYDLDSLSLFTGQFNISKSKNTSLNMQQSLLWTNEELSQGYESRNYGDGSGNSKDFSFNFQRLGLKNKKRIFTLSYLYSGFDNRSDNSLFLTQKINYPEQDYVQLNRQKNNEHSAQMDYVYPLKKGGIETGLKAIFRDNESDFGLEREVGSYQNDFTNTQNIYSWYGSGRYSLQKWNMTGGFRLENTVLHADFESAGLNISQNYINWLPTLSVNRNIGKHSIGFSYLERIQRPGIYQLNPFVDRSNPSIERTGNPDLLPAVMQDISLKYSHAGKAFILFSAGYIRIKDMLFPVITYNAETKVTQHSYDNVGKAQLLPTLIFNVNQQISKAWSYSVNARWSHATVEGLVNNEKVRNTGMMYGTYASGNYKSAKGWRWSGSLSFNGPSINIQETRNAYLYSSLSVSKDIFNEKLLWSINVSNPFTEYRKNITRGFGPDFTQYYEQKNYFRSVRISLNYKFGKLKEGVKKNSRNIRNDDVKNGE